MEVELAWGFDPAFRQIRQSMPADVLLAALAPKNMLHFLIPTNFVTAGAPYTYPGVSHPWISVWTNLPFPVRSPCPYQNVLSSGSASIDGGLALSAIRRVLLDMIKISIMISLAEVMAEILSILQVLSPVSYSTCAGELRNLYRLNNKMTYV